MCICCSKRSSFVFLNTILGNFAEQKRDSRCNLVYIEIDWMFKAVSENFTAVSLIKGDNCVQIGQFFVVYVVSRFGKF